MNRRLTPLTLYAGFWRRLAATFIDVLFESLLLTMLLIPLYVLYGGQEFSQNDPISEVFIVVAALVDMLSILLLLFYWYQFQTTPGKWLFDCKIVDARSGEAITLRQTLLRGLGYTISFFFCGLGFIWILWDKRKQGWHDKIAKTVVVLHDEATVPLHELQKDCQ